MTRGAQLLPLVTVAVWVITLLIPVLDSGNTEGPRIVVTSLGGPPFDLSETQPVFVVAWVAILCCAVSAWVARSLRWWSVVTILVAVLLGAFLLRMLVEPPFLLWDGVDAQGRPTGGQEIAEPAGGALAWAMGIGALFAAGICGLIGRTRPGNSMAPRPVDAPS